MRYLMGVDIGSTRIKTVVFDRSGRIAGSAVADTPIDYTKNGQDEWISYQPEKVWENTLQAMANAAKTVKGDIVCIAVTGMGMDSVPLDSHGEPLYPFISWRCFRGFDIFQSTAKRFGVERLYEITGQLPRYLNSVIRYLWLRENEPRLYEQTDRWLTIEDYINYKLCGEMATDYSMASTTLLCGIDRKWSDTLLDFFDIDRRLLPEILPSSAVLGKLCQEAARRTGLCAETLVVLGGHDYHCGAVSSGGFDETKLVVSTGTYECLITSLRAANPTKETLGRGMSYEGHVLPDRFSLATGMIFGGVLDWWKSNFEMAMLAVDPNISTSELWTVIMSRMTDLTDKTSMPFFMPHLFGSDAPENDPDSKGAFIGITAATTKADMLYTVIEGLNFQALSLIRSMEKATGSDFKTINVIGSISTNRFIMQQKADILGSSIIAEIQNTESVCLGAAILAGIGAGIYKDEDDAYRTLEKEYQEYHPNPEMVEIYMKRNATFKEIYKSLAPLHKSLAYY